MGKTQRTKKGEEIPVPKRDNLKKAATPEKSGEPRRRWRVTEGHTRVMEGWIRMMPTMIRDAVQLANPV
jgi:hypothetical protein